jgi:hypothetical protein
MTPAARELVKQAESVAAILDQYTQDVKSGVDILNHNHNTNTAKERDEK